MLRNESDVMVGLSVLSKRQETGRSKVLFVCVSEN
jgi:hypothetical protein